MLSSIFRNSASCLAIDCLLESLIPRLWQGVAAAIILSIIGSVLFQQFAGGFKGNAGKLFEGVVMIVASIVLGTMIVWMAKNSNIAEDLKSKAQPGKYF